MRDELTELAMTVMCARCEARPGEPCTTIKGRKADQLHGARCDAIVEAYGLGYSDAQALELKA